MFLVKGEDPLLPLGLAGHWGDPYIPWSRLTLGVAGFSLGYIRTGCPSVALL